jgi:hypothetical protein
MPLQLSHWKLVDLHLSEGKRTCGRPRCRREDNIKSNISIIEKPDLKVWSFLAQIQSMEGSCEHGNEPSLSNGTHGCGYEDNIKLDLWTLSV